MNKSVDTPDFFSSCFEMRTEINAFEKSLMTVIAQLQRDEANRTLSEENMHRYTHGGVWRHPANPGALDGSFQQVSAEGSISYSDIVSGNLEIVGKSIINTTDQLKKQFWTMMYGTISDACEASGNVVSAKNRANNAEAFKEMLQKIQFSVGRDGQVSLPQIHAAPDTAKKIIADISSQPPEFMHEMELIKAEKIAEALQREAERKSRFKSGISA